MCIRCKWLRFSYLNYTVECTSEKAQIISCKSKKIHTTYSKYLNSPKIDKTTNTIWINKVNMFGETTGFIVAIQVRCPPSKITANTYLRKTSKMVDVEKVTIILKLQNTSQNPGVFLLKMNKYLRRYNNFVKIVHYVSQISRNTSTTWRGFRKWKHQNLYWHYNIRILDYIIHSTYSTL